MANVRVRHNKFFKVVTIMGASLGLLASSCFTTFVILDSAGINPFITDELRSYTAKFMSEGSVISETKYKRGELLQQPDAPDHTVDGESNYFFIGWDTTGNGVVDVVPPRMYYSFTANAVYLKTGKFDLSFLDLTNLDLETILRILDQLDIDWVQFMEMFNIDPETLMEWLKDQVVFSFEANESKYISYFRSFSYGDFNYGKKAFNMPSYYDSTKISEGSINPLCYTADKLHYAYDLASMSGNSVLPDTFDFIDYDITYYSKQQYYPVPECEYPHGDENMVDSDSYLLTQPVNNQYQAEAAYILAKNQIIELLRSPLVRYSNTAIAADEAAYYNYAKEHYTTIPKEYDAIVSGWIEENDWYKGDFMQVDSVGNFVEHLGACSYFQDGEINVSGLSKKNNDPVMGLVENKMGTPLDFNTTAVMIFRKLNIPARLCKGYIVPAIQQGHNEVYLLNQWYWCEVYIPRIGWMICDCTNLEDILGTNPYGDMDKDLNPVEDEYILDKIEVDVPDNIEITKGDSLEDAIRDQLEATAIFTNGDDEEINFDDLEFDYDPDQIGEQEVTVTYTYKDGQTESTTFNITINEPPDEKGKGTADFDVDQTPKEFTEGTEFSYKDIGCTITYEDDTTYEVPPEDITVDTSKVDMSQPGTYPVTVSTEVDGEVFTETYQVTVKEAEIADIEVKTPPDTVTYHEQEEFDPTGLEVEFVMNNGTKVTAPLEDCEITGVSSDDMSTIDDHHEVKVSYTDPGTGEKFETSFEIDVQENPIKEVEIDNTKGEYSVGDYFDVNDFLEEAVATANLEYADATKNVDLSEAEVELDEAPDFSKEGETTVKVNVTVENAEGEKETFPVEIPITVGPVSPDKFSLSPSVATSGPGDFTGYDLFKYNTTHVGSIYFRYSCYTDYNGKADWANEVSASDIYTYNKASQYYENATVDVEYLKDTEYSFVPAYSDDTKSGAKKEGDKDEGVTFTTFELTSESYSRLQMYVKYDSTVNTNYTTYRSQTIYGQDNPYLKDTASEEAKTLIQDFIKDNNINKNDDKVSNALKIRNILKSYKYNAKFNSYDSSKDPVYSFLKEKEGICSDFGTAAVMIFREVGIPARFATGFAVQSYGGEGTCNTTRAHGWSEIWLDNLGWVIVDCTGYDNESADKDMSPEGINDYGNPPAGEGEGDLYTFGLESYGTGISIKYFFNGTNITDDPVDKEYEITYNGLGYKDLITFELDYDENKLPFFLELKSEVVENGKEEQEDPCRANGYNGSFVGKYSYKVKLTLLDKQTKKDVTAKYGFSATNTRVITYVIVPYTLIVNVGLKGGQAYIGTTYDKASFTATADNTTPIPQKDGKALDTLDFTIATTTISFATKGTFYDYGYYYDSGAGKYADRFIFSLSSNNYTYTLDDLLEDEGLDSDEIKEVKDTLNDEFDSFYPSNAQHVARLKGILLELGKTEEQATSIVNHVVSKLGQPVDATGNYIIIPIYSAVEVNY